MVRYNRIVLLKRDFPRRNEKMKEERKRILKMVEDGKLTVHKRKEVKKTA